MRAIIAGGREFNNYPLLKKECLNTFRQLKSEGYDTSRGSLEIISGTARGADKLGERFAEEHKIRIKKFPAEWNNLNVEKCIVRYNQYGKPYNVLAGHNRNENMAEYASQDEDLGVLIAFWNKKSKGTKNMIDLANKYGLRVFIIEYEGKQIR